VKLHLLFSPRVMAEGRLVGLGCEASRCLHGGAKPSDMPLLLADILATFVQLGGSSCPS
jgi:hypothetical protein